MNASAVIAVAIVTAVVSGVLAFATLARRSDARCAGLLSAETCRRDQAARTDAHSPALTRLDHRIRLDQDHPRSRRACRPDFLRRHSVNDRAPSIARLPAHHHEQPPARSCQRPAGSASFRATNLAPSSTNSEPAHERTNDTTGHCRTWPSPDVQISSGQGV